MMILQVILCLWVIVSCSALVGAYNHDDGVSLTSIFNVIAALVLLGSVLFPRV